MVSGNTIMCRKRYEQSESCSGILEFLVWINEPLKGHVNGKLEVQLIALSSSNKEYYAKTELQTVNGGEQQLMLDTYVFPDGPTKIDVLIEKARFSFFENISNGNSEQARMLRLKSNRLSSGFFFSGPCDSQLFLSMNDENKDSIMLTKRADNFSSRRLFFETEGFHIEQALVDRESIEKAANAFSVIKENETHGHRNGSSERLVNIHKDIEELQAIYNNPKIREVVNDLLGEQSYPAQSLSFIHGSEQSAHADWVHLSTFPIDSMCGVWIALEDVIEDSGELFYFQGSHSYPRISMSMLELTKISPEFPDWSEFGERYNREIERVVVDSGKKPTRFLPKAGDVLFWHENLIHGGSPRGSNTLTRYSMVIHFFKQSCYAWYDSTGISGNKDFT